MSTTTWNTSLRMPRAAFSLFTACRLYYPAPMFPGALSLSSRLRLSRERNRILSVSILRPPSPPSLSTLSPHLLPGIRPPLFLSRFPSRWDRPRLAKDLRRRPLSQYRDPASVFCPPRGRYFIGVDRYVDTMISEFFLERSYRRARNIAPIMTSLVETRQLRNRENSAGNEGRYTFGHFPVFCIKCKNIDPKIEFNSIFHFCHKE